MTPWLFNLFMDRIVVEMITIVSNAEVVSVSNIQLKLHSILFADVSVLLA